MNKKKEGLFVNRYRCSEKKKYANDCELAKEIANELIPNFTQNRDWIEDHDSMLSNYRLYNNDISQEDFEMICNPLGIDVGQYDEEVLPYNKTYTKIDVLLGEEFKRNTNFIVALMNAKAIEEKDEELRAAYMQYIEAVVEKAGAIADMIAQGASEEEIQEVVEQEIQARTPEELESMTFLSELEILGNHILRYGLYKQEVKSLKNDGFKHALLSDKEFAYVGVFKGEPCIRLLNPLNIFYSKSPDIKWIQDGDYAGVTYVKSVERILEEHGEKLKQEDLDKLLKKVPTYSTKKHTGQLEVNVQDTLTNRFLHKMVSHEYLGKNVGLYTDDYESARKLMQDSFEVETHVEWKWLREVVFMTTINEYGDEDTEILDPEIEVIIPEEAVKIEFTNRYGDKTFKHEWVDEEGNSIIIEKLWIPRIWEATRIGFDMFVDVREKPNQPFDIEDVFNIELGYYGCVYNSMNARPISLMSRMKPFQFLFFVVLHQIKELIPKHIGPIQNFDTSMIDPNLGNNDTEDGFQDALQKTFYYRQKGLNIYNSMINNIGGQATNTNISRPQPGNVQNMSVAQDLNNLLELLGWLDNQIGLAAGVSQQREAQFSSNTNVTDNQQAIIQSSHITEHYFRKHDDLWRKIMEAYINYAKLAWKDKKVRRQYLLPDTSIHTLEITNHEKLMSASYGLFMTDASKENRYIEEMSEMAKMFIQNGASVETVSYILKSRTNGTSPEEIHKMIAKMQKQQEAKEQAAAEAERESQEKLAEMQIEAREDEQEHEIQLETMKIEKDLTVAEIQSSRFKQMNDVNDNAVHDMIELEEMKQNGGKIDHDKQIKEKEIKIKEKELALKERKITIDKILKEQELKIKARQANKKPSK